MQRKIEALKLLDESLKVLETQKGSILSGVQKLFRASEIIGKNEICIWCSIQQGDSIYVLPLQEFLKINEELSNIDKNEDTEAYNKILKKGQDHYQELQKIGLTPEIHYPIDELNIKNHEASGGYNNIGFIEERYADLVRTKKGNDGTFYKNQLNNHLNYVRKRAHQFASQLSNQLKFSGTVASCFDILKQLVDDRLLDLEPLLAEKMMLAFKSISSDKEEEWSQALTTCRRLLENLADNLYPATKETLNGRNLGQGQYINRLWAFMDKAIESNTNKELAKTHIDFLGSWLQNSYKLSNKGVHTNLNHLEAVKAVFHTYLILADILEYISKDTRKSKEISIKTISLDELESILDISRNTAKEIIKLRVQQETISLDDLSQIKGIGQKTLEKIKEIFKI